MKKYLSFWVIVMTTIILNSCKKEEQNPNIPNVFINITIDPNSTIYQELNTAGGWLYLTSTPPSRGIIVYRIDQNQFVAYDRMPPNDPDRCCDDDGNCTRLVVGDNFPFAKDECNNISYLLLNGSIFEGEGKYPLIQYNTSYNGQLLRIFN